MDVRNKVALLPHSPGVYRFYDSTGTIIYIGKAKDLHKRVSSYFVAVDRKPVKTKMLVSKIADVAHTVVETEEDAFLLENNLIKQYKPKYNILLKDSKGYPWIALKNELFPRIMLTRRFVKDGSQYFGPYSSVVHAKEIIKLINSLFPLRDCNLQLTMQGIGEGRFKPCLNYHIKRCLAPCAGCVSKEEYDNWTDNIREILRGNSTSLIKQFKEKMEEASGNLEFEKAMEYKGKIELLRNHYSKSLIVHPSINNLDVFSVVFEKGSAFGNFMRINGGCIVQTFNMEFRLGVEEEQSDVLARFIIEAYKMLWQGKNSGKDDIANPLPDNFLSAASSTEILVPFLPSEMDISGRFKVPVKGDKAALMDLSSKNANAFKFERLKQEEIKNPQEADNNRLQRLKEDLRLKHLPYHIECFDNSNIQGTNPVASCVVFKNGKPSKKDYRHFKIKTVVGANDFASMYEVVHRRYSRLLEEGGELPQLVLIDGGKGQLSSAYNALLDLGLTERIEIVSIAKRLEEIISPHEANSFLIGKSSPSLKILMHLRDEAHRFGITFHRQLRSKGQINSRLREIPGIGEATEQKLLQHFKSVKRIKEATFEELESVAGKRAAKLIVAADL